MSNKLIRDRLFQLVYILMYLMDLLRGDIHVIAIEIEFLVYGIIQHISVQIELQCY